MAFELHFQTTGRPGTQIVEHFREQVRTGRLAPGHRVPSVRKLARELGVAPMTVVRAYAQLRAEGILETRGGSGTQVAVRPSPGAAGLMLARIPRAGPLNVYEPLSEAAGTVSLASSVPDPGFAVVEEILPGCFDALRESVWNAYYAPARGTADYVNAVVDLLAQDGIAATPEGIVATFGSTHARTTVLRSLTRPGDGVAIEAPGRLDAFAWATGHGVRPIPVPRDRGRLDLERLALAFKAGCRLFFTMPTYGSTTGDAFADGHREELLALAARFGAIVVEDASYAANAPNRCFFCKNHVYARLGFGPPEPAPLAAREPSLVVTVESFSYCVSPALRLGYVRASGEIVARVAEESQRSVQSGMAPLQTAFGRWMATGGLERHLRRVLLIYRARRDAMVAALRRHMPPGTRWTDPAGGYSLWLSLPPGRFDDLYEAALAAGVPFAPGALFIPEGGEGHLRLSYARHAPETLTRAVRILAGLVRDRIGQG